jgi:hypothetical protein
LSLPSHEALLPNVPYENVLAMARAAKAYASLCAAPSDASSGFKPRRCAGFVHLRILKRARKAMPHADQHRGDVSCKKTMRFCEIWQAVCRKSRACPFKKLSARSGLQQRMKPVRPWC